MNHRNWLILTVAVVALFASSSMALAQTTPTQTPKLTQENAEKIALDKTGGGQVVRGKLDTENGLLVYEFKIINGDTKYEVSVNADTGEIVEFEQKPAKRHAPRPTEMPAT